MSLSTLNASIVGTVDTDKHQIQFRSVFGIAPDVAPISSVGYDYSIGGVTSADENTAYTPQAAGVSIDSNTGLFSWNPSVTRGDYLITIICRPFLYGYAMARFKIFYRFRLYDFGVPLTPSNLNVSNAVPENNQENISDTLPENNQENVSDAVPENNQESETTP